MSNLAVRSASFYNKTLTMSKLRDRLSKFEALMQTFIEGGTTRIISGGETKDQINTRLLEAMQRSVTLDPEGRTIAADTYIMVVGSENAQILSEDLGVTEAMQQLLVEKGRQSGITFQAPPRVKISIDNSLGPAGWKISSSFCLRDMPETSTLTVDPGDEVTVPQDAFLIIDGNQVVPLTEQVLNLGRRSDNQIVIDNPQVSRKHAQLRVINNRFVIFDLESTGGTFVNRIRVEQASLFPGDVISLAGVELVYGQDAGLFSSGSTQPLMPFPDQGK